MVINCGNPVVSGPDGAKLDKALEQLDLLVAIDLVQRESHRHAHWLLPAVHWLERDDLLAFTSNMHDEPYLQYGAKVVEPPPGARQEWRIFVDLAIAMRKPLFGAKGVNGFIKATRRVARLTRQAEPRVRAALDRPAGGGDRPKVQRPQDQMARRDGAPARHGCSVRGSSATSGTRCEPTTRRCTPRRRSSSSARVNCSPNRAPAAPDGYPFQLANRRNRHSMNSWLNELPGLHPSGKKNDVVINPEDAAALGVGDGDRVRVFSSVGEIELAAAVNEPTPPRRRRSSTMAGAQGFSTRAAAARRSRSAPTATCSSTADRSTRCRRPPR